MGTADYREFGTTDYKHFKNIVDNPITNNDVKEFMSNCTQHADVAKWIHESKNYLQQINHKLEQLNEVVITNGDRLEHKFQRNQFLQKSYDTIKDYEVLKPEIIEKHELLDKTVEIVADLAKQKAERERDSLQLSKHWKVALGVIGAISTILVIVTQIIILAKGI